MLLTVAIKDDTLGTFGGCTGGFDAGLHGVFEIFGVCRRWRCRPCQPHRLGDEKLSDGLRRIGML